MCLGNLCSVVGGSDVQTKQWRTESGPLPAPLGPAAGCAPHRGRGAPREGVPRLGCASTGCVKRI